jgi:hypothetical protein
MAQAGGAAAAFAHQLPASREGQRVATWLRQAAVTPGEPGQHAARNLREAVRVYLDRFPGANTALGMTVRLVAERLGVRAWRAPRRVRYVRPLPLPSRN